MLSGRLMRLISSNSALYGEAKDGTLCEHDKGVESCSRAAAVKSMLCLALRRVKQLVSSRHVYSTTTSDSACVEHHELS